ncbi:hypothetical protein EVA_02388 [gut metagenome]|uniref:Uncharacterized protein n=1 Tax=gut metagenome TaxID=749906 RepID=J9H199_9ZZZZ
MECNIASVFLQYIILQSCYKECRMCDLDIVCEDAGSVCSDYLYY